jgi:ABC-type iron transport system FetAB ATPase subunit
MNSALLSRWVHLPKQSFFLFGPRGTGKSTLQSFLQDYPSASAILLYRGNEILRQGNIRIMPCEIFLQQLQPNRPLIEDDVR